MLSCKMESIPAFVLFIPFALVRFAQQVIDAGIVETGQADQNSGGNVVFAGFVFGITGLRHPEYLCHLRLIHVFVFPIAVHHHGRACIA